MLKTLRTLRKEKPLILNITNFVTMDFVANGLLSLGGLPIMCHAENEIEDLVKLASAVVINLGTLNSEFILLCKKACEVANQLNKPIILDPVGAGASHYRTDSNLFFLTNYKIAVIRGNASEIEALSINSHETKGVDSTIETEAVIDNAILISQEYNSAVVITGKTDVIIDQDNLIALNIGSAMMKKVTGMGCLLSAVIAAFHAVEKNRFEAAKAAVKFSGMGYPVMELEGGFDEWKEHGLKIEK